MLKAKIFRWIVKMMPVFYWRNKMPMNLEVDNTTLPVKGGSIAARFYIPETQGNDNGPYPVMLYFHGGGFVVGNLDSCEPICRELAARNRHVVVAVDYRLSPEFPFPTAAEDCIAALDWLVTQKHDHHIDLNAVTLAGDSAGGNLATVVALQARKKHPGLVKAQLLMYPVTHHYSHETPSYLEFTKTRSLNRDMMVWFWDTYYLGNQVLPAGKVEHALSTPLALDDLSGLPPAMVIVAEKDPLRDEGKEYAQKMQSQGVAVTLKEYPAVEHGFIGYVGPTPEHQQGMADIKAWLDSIY